MMRRTVNIYSLSSYKRSFVGHSIVIKIEFGVLGGVLSPT